MKNPKKRERKLMRTRNSDRLNRIKNQQVVLSPVFVLVLIKLGISNLNASGVLGRLRLHILNLTGNADFPVTVPDIAALTAKADELETAIAEAVSRDKNKIEIRNNLTLEAEELIRILSQDIQLKSGGIATKIHSTGFETRKQGTPRPLPGQVVVTKIGSGAKGKIRMKWNPITDAGNVVYIVEMSTDPMGENWQFLAKTTVSRFTAIDLNSGKQYYFRITASNSRGNGEPSETVEQVCS